MSDPEKMRQKGEEHGLLEGQLGNFSKMRYDSPYLSKEYREGYAQGQHLAREHGWKEHEMPHWGR